MIERATGLILRIRPLTDSSLIVRWITLEAGLLNTVAKGARQPKSPFAGKLDLCFLARLSYRKSRRSDLHNLAEVVLDETHSRLRTGLDRLRAAARGATLIEKYVEPDQPDPGLYHLYHTLIAALAEPIPADAPLLTFWFELQFLNHVGLRPPLDSFRGTEGCRKLLKAILDHVEKPPGNLRATPAQHAEITAFLNAFIQSHLTGIQPSPPQSAAPDRDSHPSHRRPPRYHSGPRPE